MVGIDAKDAEVARLARPHPIVGVTAELTQGLRGCEDEADVIIHLIDGHIESIATIVGLHETILPGVLIGVFLLHSVHHRIQVLAVQRLWLHTGIGLVYLVHGTHHAARTFLGSFQEAHEEAFHGTLILIGLGSKAVLQDVVVGGGEFLYTRESAMVVGKYQSFRAYDHT